MPSQRYRRLRVQVYRRTENKDATWGTNDETYTALRYQYLLSLEAISGTRQGLMNRSDFTADWEATVWALPEVKDGDRLELTFQGAGAQILEVKKQVLQNRKRFLFLKEIGTLQAND